MGRRGFPARPAWERMHDKYEIDPQTGCWVWTGAVNNQGYGQIGEYGRTVYAHRVAYENCVGPIPDGMVVDHMCNVTRCVNPDHLQVLTNRQNIMRSTSPNIMRHWLNTCIRGHDLTDPKVVYYRRDNGGRACRECARLLDRQRRSKAA